jgi:hypothetical protein
MIDPFYCKECGQSRWLETSPAWNGDVIVTCGTPGCGKQHHRQFEAGVAVSCEVVTSRKPRRVTT